MPELAFGSHKGIIFQYKCCFKVIKIQTYTQFLIILIIYLFSFFSKVDFSYPPLIEGQPEDSHDVPSEWKHLPFLALPDGAHNFEDGKKETLSNFVHFFFSPFLISRNVQYTVSCTIHLYRLKI